MSMYKDKVELGLKSRRKYKLTVAFHKIIKGVAYFITATNPVLTLAKNKNISTII